MNRSFHADAASRLDVYALQAQLQIQILNKSMTLKDYGLTSKDMQTWFVFQVMLFLMHRTLELDDNDGCTMDEIAWQVQEIIKNEYSFTLDSDQCYSLTKTIISDILSNGGSPIEFQTGTLDSSSVQLSYLSSPMVRRGGVSVGAYRMATDGFRIMLSTREVEENLKVSVNAMIISMQVKSRNYSGALEQAKDEIDRLRIHENNIRENIVRLKADVLSISAEKAEALFQENLQVFEEARERFKEIRQTVALQMEDVRSELASQEGDQKLMNNLDLMNQIDEYIQASILVTGRIITALQDFIYTLRNELLNQMSMQAMRKRTIRKDLYEPVLAAGEVPEDLLADLLAPLFSKPVEPILTPEIFLEVKRLKDEIQEDTEVYSDEAADEAFERMQEMRRKKVLKMHEVTREFLQRLMEAPGHTLSLEDFQKMAADHEGSLIKELLASWSMNRSIDLADLFSQEKELDAAGLDMIYSLPLSYLQAASVYPALRGYASLNMEKARGEVRFSFMDDGLHYALVIDNLVFTLKRKEL